MKNPRSSIRLLDSDKGTLRRFNTGISLHCHTQQSKEILDFVPASFVRHWKSTNVRMDKQSISVKHIGRRPSFRVR
jgi:hypothetical protein